MTTPTPHGRRLPTSTIILAILLALAVAAAVAFALGWFKPGTPEEPAGAQAPARAMASATDTVNTVLKRLTDAGLPLSNIAVTNENTDPNDLLGRPNGYIARASFELPDGDMDAEQYDMDRGGAIEVWPDDASAHRRSTYLLELDKAAPILGNEYNYVRGPVLLRITGKVKPSVAAQFEAAFMK